jgi:excisionase family DNA binding protein
MQQTVFISLPVEDLQSLIIGCVNSCLSHHPSYQNHEPEADELLTIEDAADLLKLAKSTVYGLVSRSEIPYSKKSKRLYFSKLELLEWVRTGRNKTTAEISAEATNYINRKRK